MPHDEFVPEDPMELVGMALPGGPGMLEAMAETFVDEYVRLGWDEERLMTLFRNPFFQGTYRVYHIRGEEYVRQLIRRTIAKWGIRAAPETRLHPIALDVG
ncbi:MAG: hypothetical protein KJZ86_05930 [Caldilineaceae bacterium]|nr:hypothetical protein [Caldilineaceae bacterium]HRJ40333.1 hypothetical protein [Caldilineaceae bacterium]